MVNNENMSSFDINNIMFGDKISGNELSRYYIYYQANDMVNELYITLPRLRLIFNNFLNQKYEKINLPIYPLWKKTKQLLEFINFFEKTIIEAFNSKLEFQSIVSRHNTLDLLKMTVKHQPTILSELGNLTFSDFRINSEVELVIKINSVWFNKKKSTYGLSCHLCQIKYHAPLEQTKLTHVIPPPPLHTNIPAPITIYKKSLLESGTSIPTINKIIPTVADLQNALKKLKKN